MVYCLTLNRYAKIVKEFDESSNIYEVKVSGQEQVEKINAKDLSVYINVQIKIVTSDEDDCDDTTDFKVRISEPIEKLLDAFFTGENEGYLIGNEKLYTKDLL